MDPQVPASFIPKKPLTVSGSSRGGFGGLFGLLSFLVFIASVLGAGGTFLYKQYLTTSLAAKDASLKRAEAAYDPGVIQDLTRLDARITQAKGLMDKHVALTSFFNFLSSITLESVQFTSFDYEIAQDGSATINLKGIAKDFSAVALQSDQFGSNRTLKNVVFSDIAVGTGNTVTFAVQATVDPSILSYRKSLSTQTQP
jgi:hypothetical protein